MGAPGAACPGKRALTQAEPEAWFVYGNEFGHRMGIDGLSATLAEFRMFADAYEARPFVDAPGDRLIAERTIDLALSMYNAPRALHSAARPAALAICDARLFVAPGFPKPSARLRRLARGARGLRRAILGRLPPNSEANWPPMGTTTYPEGYNIGELGTFALTRMDADGSNHVA